ncbi:MAG: glycyl-tRNA synthetase beta chain [Rhodospirillaceae bacterium]|nr:MAG: glycyl-tRNA synthetase beta chain [Rhodospirillaceae bacterium]
MPQFLLEILSEEIPARMQIRAADDLKRLVCAGLAAGGLTGLGEQARAFVTPRRLTLALADLPAAVPGGCEERRGPRADASPQAIAGFLTACGITQDQMEVRETPKGTFCFAVIVKNGRPTAELLKEVVESALAAFPWPKSMRWGRIRERWVRPVHRILCTFDKAVIPVRFAGVAAGDVTEGHRFLAPITFPVRGFDCYERGLREAHVLLDPAERAGRIRGTAMELAHAAGLTLKADDDLLAEVTGLVEWPVVLMGHIDEGFMDVPAEVLTTAMRTHQKYFSLLDVHGHLAPRFLMVANVTTEDGGKAIVAGNERVLRARLSDARFFWNQDRGRPLHDRVDALKARIFHARLGSMAEKMERVRTLARTLAEYVPGADPALVDRAVLLAKADLSTGMVGEFPELQGTMGRYYARHDGEAPEVCAAIAEHYSPLGPNDACPFAPVSVCVALADKIDTLVGFWTINEKPTGSKDPFALRRAALGVIRLVLENGVRLPLLAVFRQAAGLYDAVGAAFEALSLLDFFADRLKVHLREKGVRHDLIAAVFALGNEEDLVRLLARVEALSRFLATDDGITLLTACRRAMNIVRIEEKKDNTRYHGPVDADLLQAGEERDLETGLFEVEKNSHDAINAEKFDETMAALSRLRGPVDAFFKRVTVNSAESRLRANRLKLLSRIGAATKAIADFTKIKG